MVSMGDAAVLVACGGVAGESAGLPGEQEGPCMSVNPWSASVLFSLYGN